MSGIIQRGSVEHKRHMAGAEIEKVSSKQSAQSQKSKDELKAGLTLASKEDGVAIAAELAELDKSDAEYLAGFKSGINRDGSDKSWSAERKSRYAAGLSAGKEASPDKPRTDIQATSPAALETKENK